MMGIGILRGLLTSTPATLGIADGFVHVDPATSAAMDVARKVDLSTIAVVGDEGLAPAARKAVTAGLDIVWIGMAPKDVRTGPDGFTALVRMRIDGECVQRSVLLASDARHRIVSATSVEQSPGQSGESA